MSSDLRLAQWVEGERERIVGTLFDYLRIPSISAQPAYAPDVRRAAEFTADYLRASGLEHVEILETDGAPAVYGDWLHAGPGAPTALVYGHHDVQPVDPLDEWTSPPFEPVMVDGECRARGAIDDKGQMVLQIEAVRGLLSTEGRLPVNVRFLVEGEEEIGSPYFEPLLHQERDRLACDVVVVSDTTMWAPDVPSTTVAMRGVATCDLHVRTAEQDLHSGVFGGAVPNAAHVLARLVAALHDGEGRIAVPGFYDDVRPLTEAELRSLEALPFDEARWMKQAGVQRLEGEAGRSVLERVWTRPTCDVIGITVGYGGEGTKTIVPAAGTAKLTFRLVPDQQGDRVCDLVAAWARRQVPEGIDVEVVPGPSVGPTATPVDHPAMGALSRAIEAVWGTAPLFTRTGGSGPEEALQRVLDAPVVYLGVGLPDDRFHAPNERMVMDQFWKGLLACGELWHELRGAMQG